MLECLLTDKFDNKNALISGRAGSGKTVLLRKWALEFAKKAAEQLSAQKKRRTFCWQKIYRHELINNVEKQLHLIKWLPLYLPLGWVGHLCNGNPSWNTPLAQLTVDYFTDEDSINKGILIRVLSAIIHSGKAIILLDGADEVPEESRPFVKSWLERIQRQTEQCHIIITSRPGTYYLSGINGFKEFDVKDFEMVQIISFIYKWFEFASKNVSDEMIAELNQSISIQKMAGNPLFLTMMCVEAEIKKEINNGMPETRMFPKNITPGILYEQFFRNLLEYWDCERGVVRSLDDKRTVPLEFKMNILGEIAYKFFEKGQITLIENELTENLKNLRAADANDTIDEIEKTSGILVSGRQGNYRFCHPSFQDFFTARYYVLQVRNGQINEKKWIQDTWQNYKFQSVGAFFQEIRQADE